MNKALFLDRDGVINIDYGHVHSRERFKFIEGIFELCKIFQNLGYLIIVITNQAGIGKGYYTEETFNELNEWMILKFNEAGVTIMKTYYCPHVPEDNCFCRKPNPGMIIKAMNEYKIDLSKSFFIGDKESDIEAGKKAGIQNLVLFKNTDHFKTIDDLRKIRQGEYDGK